MNYRGTWLEIDTEAIKNNLETIHNITSNRPILLPVKADAYGHGMIETARFAEKSGLINMFGVASIEEGICLRENGINLPILILSYIIPGDEQINALIKYNLMPTIGDIDTAQRCNLVAGAHNIKIKIHIKTDTGMGRLGCPASESVHTCNIINQLENIFIEGFYTHMPVSDESSNPFNNNQIADYKKITEAVRETLGRKPVLHMANSGAVLYYPDTFFDMVRPGIISYGYMPDPASPHDKRFKQSMSLFSTIIMMKKVNAGSALSYGHTYKLNKESWIATIPCGYGDGFHRSLSNNALVVINDRKYPVAGRICMDLLLIDCGDDYFDVGTKVEIFGTDDVTVETTALKANTIPYEITCSMALRIARIYK